jgi:hypothetical protein
VVIAVRPAHRRSKSEQRERRSDRDSLHGPPPFAIDQRPICAHRRPVSIG